VAVKHCLACRGRVSISDAYSGPGFGKTKTYPRHSPESPAWAPHTEGWRPVRVLYAEAARLVPRRHSRWAKVLFVQQHFSAGSRADTQALPMTHAWADRARGNFIVLCQAGIR
jgi:hypothetical protein